MRQLLIALLAIAALTACSEPVTNPEPEPEQAVTADVEDVPTTPPPEPEQPAPPTAPGTEISQRGNAIKEIGETAFAYETDPADPWLEFQVTDIEVDGQCTEEFAEPPENGHFLFVTISASTSSAWPAELQGLTVDFSAFDFSIIGKDGLTESSLDTIATFGCLPESELLPIDGIGPGENVTGKLILDTANPSGVLVFRPWFLGTGGWEWTY